MSNEDIENELMENIYSSKISKKGVWIRDQFKD